MRKNLVQECNIERVRKNLVQECNIERVRKNLVHRACEEELGTGM